MVLFAVIGAKALYLLFVWLLSAAAGSWLADRKGYGERVGLTFGLLLSALGLVIVLLLPAVRARGGSSRGRCRAGPGIPERSAPTGSVAILGLRDRAVGVALGRGKPLAWRGSEAATTFPPHRASGHSEPKQ